MTDRERLDEATALLERITKYAREDRARTPGVTRLARACEETECWLTRATAPEAEPVCTHDGIGLPGCSICDPSTGPRHEAQQETARLRATLASVRDVVQQTEARTRIEGWYPSAIDSLHGPAYRDIRDLLARPAGTEEET